MPICKQNAFAKARADMNVLATSASVYQRKLPVSFERSFHHDLIKSGMHGCDNIAHGYTFTSCDLFSLPTALDPEPTGSTPGRSAWSTCQWYYMCEPCHKLTTVWSGREQKSEHRFAVLAHMRRVDGVHSATAVVHMQITMYAHWIRDVLIIIASCFHRRSCESDASAAHKRLYPSDLTRLYQGSQYTGRHSGEQLGHVYSSSCS